jgi:hypothetical protein
VRGDNVFLCMKLFLQILFCVDNEVELSNVKFDYADNLQVGVKWFM